ncbi:hypothetical protein PM082_022748 [Marasmius tenuissimus]|nr:hypothetical protein PM082_022748 [Marasmius tenuissimus]
MTVSGELSCWSFSLKTGSWKYDLLTVSISFPTDDTSFDPIVYKPENPLYGSTRTPRLNADDVVAYFEHQFGDFLYMIAASGETRHVGEDSLSEFARHGYLTFGAVVNRRKPGIVAHLPSTRDEQPEWYCESLGVDVEARYSTSVPWRVDLSFRNTGRNQAHIHFSLRSPNGIRRRAAYLSQSRRLLNDSKAPLHDLAFIDEIRFSLVGTFHVDSERPSRTPVYLFVPPVPVDFTDQVYSIRYPLLDRLFYRSLDLNGKNDILDEEDWKKYGIPKLDIHEWIGTFWASSEYSIVLDYVGDEMRHAGVHRYPELVWDDSHSSSTPVREQDTLSRA